MRCVFLDRDGVINYSKIIDGKPYAPTKFKEFKLIKGVKQGLEIIKKKTLKYVFSLISQM